MNDEGAVISIDLESLISNNNISDEDMDEITLDYTVSNSTTTDDCTGVWVRN